MVKRGYFVRRNVGIKREGRDESMDWVSWIIGIITGLFGGVGLVLVCQEIIEDSRKGK